MSRRICTTIYDVGKMRKKKTITCEQLWEQPHEEYPQWQEVDDHCLVLKNPNRTEGLVVWKQFSLQMDRQVHFSIPPQTLLEIKWQAIPSSSIRAGSF